MKKQFSPGTLAYAGVLIAMNVVLSRLVSIPIGNLFRISVAHVPIILCGLWLGPLIGGIAGAAGDLIGCAFMGYAPNPFLTVSACLVGIIPSLFKKFILGGEKGTKRYLRYVLVIALTMLITSQGLTTLGLSVMYGMPFKATFISRLPQSGALCVLNSFLVNLLYPIYYHMTS